MLLPTLLVTIASVGLAILGLHWATTKSDEAAAARQIRETQRAVSHSVDSLAKEQEIVAIWDDTVVQLAKANPDWQWVDDNIGIWLHDLFGHDEVYILDAADRPVYASAGGSRGEPESFESIRQQLLHLIQSVRIPGGQSNNPHERLPGLPLHPRAGVLTTDKAVHSTDVTQISGRPAAVSVMKIAPLTDAITQPGGSEPLLINVRFLDGGFLQQLSQINLIASPRFSPTATLRDGERGVELRSEHGLSLGYFIWRPELPGSAVRAQLLPSTTLAIAGILIMMAYLASSLRRALRDQQTALIELEASEAQAQHLAFHDVLTGLPNRAVLNERLEQALALAYKGRDSALLLLDLDRFKQVNDTLGHQAGDTLICEVARRLSALLGGSDTLARLGGDEFAIVHSMYFDQQDLKNLCDGIIAEVGKPFTILGTQCFVGVTIGVALLTGARADRSDIMRMADIALYRAKEQGRGRYQLFTPDLDESMKIRRALEGDLRKALHSDRELLMHYQPQFGPTAQIVGLEALVRWEHPTRGYISPAQFIPIAEESGIINELGDWVLREACLASRRYPSLFMAINLSAVQFRSTDFPQKVLRIIEETGADPRFIELEVTESVLLSDTDSIRAALKQFRLAGIRIALDDFGTGYSSLSYLRQFNVDKIKIDQSFIQAIGETGDSSAIINAMITLGHAMGLTVTAEGVETDEQQQFLSSAGCDLLQGFRCSRPLPEKELASLLEAEESKAVRKRNAA